MTTEVPRDKWGAPLIKDPETGVMSPYERISSAGSVLDRQDGLTNWKLRMAVRGVAISPHLIALASSSDSKATLNRVAKEAMTAAGGGSAAGLGTAVHTFTELVDRGEAYSHAPSNLVPALDGYKKTLAAHGFVAVGIEEFVVVDELRYAGTLDRVLKSERTGRHYIADVKTGADTPTYALSTAVQTALYSRGKRYDPETGERSDLPRVDPDVAILIHLPLDGRPCALYVLDIALGWEGAKQARWVLDWRRGTGARALGTSEIF